MMSVGLVGIGVWPLIAKPAGLSKVNESEQDMTNKMICVPSKDSDQPRHLLSLISPYCLPEGLRP